MAKLVYAYVFIVGCMICGKWSLGFEVQVDVDGGTSLGDDKLQVRAEEQEDLSAPKQNDQQKDLSSLQEELKELDNEIKLQQRKIKVLAELRKAATDEGATISSDSRKWSIGTELADSVRPLNEEHDFVPIEGTSPHEAFMLLRSSIDLPNGLVDATALTPPRKRDMSLIVTADKAGWICFYTTLGEKIYSFDTARQDITGITFSFLRGKPSLLVQFKAKGVHLYNLVVWVNGEAIAGNTTATTSSRNSDYDGVRISMELDQIITTSASPRKVDVVHTRSHDAIAISLDNAKIEFFDRNGTMLRRRAFKSASSALGHNGRVLAIAEGSYISFYHYEMDRMLPPAFQCNASAAEVTSIAFDRLSTNLYAGTATGDIFLFDTKNTARGSMSCRLIYRLSAQNSQNKHPIVVATVKGYLLSYSDMKFQVHNTTRIEGSKPHYLFHQTFEANVEPAIETPLLKAFAIHKPGGETRSIVIRASSSRKKMHVMESLLPYSRPVYEPEWFQKPLIISVVVVVFCFQFYYMRKNKSREETPWEKMGGIPGMQAGMQAGMRPGSTSSFNDMSFD